MNKSGILHAIELEVCAVAVEPYEALAHHAAEPPQIDTGGSHEPRSDGAQKSNRVTVGGAAPRRLRKDIQAGYCGEAQGDGKGCNRACKGNAD